MTAPTDYVLKDWTAAGLHRPSASRPFLATVHATGITAVGRFSDHDWQEVQARLKKPLTWNSEKKMLTISDLPTVNATLNVISIVLLILGFFMIRQRKITAHRNCMIAAFVASAFFLASYLIYHYHVGSTPFEGQGWIRSVYFIVLIPHIILAACILPLALITLYFAWRKRFTKHRRIARWTLPIWLYVSVTGIIVYWMLYHLQ